MHVQQIEEYVFILIKARQNATLLGPDATSQSEGVTRTGYSVPVRGALGAGLCTGTCWRAAVVVAVGVT